MMGHGWVTPRPDGRKARCGGPSACQQCQQEASRLRGRDPGGRQEDPRQLELPLSPIPDIQFRRECATYCGDANCTCGKREFIRDISAPL